MNRRGEKIFTLINIASCQNLMNSKMLSKPKSFSTRACDGVRGREEGEHEKGANLSQAHGVAMKNMAKNKSRAKIFFTICLGRENRLFSFEEKLRKGISLLTLRRSHTHAVEEWRSEAAEHVIKTFTHEVKISLICFHCEEEAKGRGRRFKGDANINSFHRVASCFTRKFWHES